MTARLQDIVNEIETSLADASVTVLYGQKELHRIGEPPRLTFVPVSGVFEPASEIGRQDVSPTATRTLHERNVTCEVYCWGVDLEAAEQLMHNAIVAIHDAVGPQVYGLGNERWISEQDVEAGDVNLGDVVMFEAGFRVPVTNTPKTLRESPTSATHEGKFSGETVC